MRKFFITMLALSVMAVAGCSDDSSDDSGVSPVTNPYKVCAGEVPDGVGIDLDNNIAYNLEENPDFEWDIRIKVIKADYADPPAGSGTVKGAPHIKLYGTILKAYKDVIDTGEAYYNGFAFGDVIPGDLAADGVTELNISGVPTDPEGFPYYKGPGGLNAYYGANLVISNDWKLSPWTIGNELIYIIETDEGNYVKFMVKGMGEAGSNPGKKYIDVIFEVLE